MKMKKQDLSKELKENLLKRKTQKKQRLEVNNIDNSEKNVSECNKFDNIKS
jgi:hypothetical protein